MKHKKIMGVTAATIAVATMGVVGALGLNQASAEESTDTTAGRLVQNLAKAFGVTTDEVEEVMQTTREEEQDERLDALVEDGELTQEQRDALEAKMEEHQAAMQEIMNSSMTAEERREAMQTLREEMQTWEEENGIDLPAQGPMGPQGDGAGMGGHGMGGGMMSW